MFVAGKISKKRGRHMQHQQEPMYTFPLTPEEAATYLRTERGILYSVASLRNLRRRGRAESKGVKSRTTLWTKAELDAITPTSRTRMVAKEERIGGSPSVIFMDSLVPHHLVG